MMTITEIKELIEKGEYNYYGLRADSEKIYDIGDICENSHQWWPDYYGDPDDEDALPYNEDLGCWDGGELDGTCAVWITEETVEESLNQVKGYIGDNIILIAGNSCQDGNDPMEVIIEDAKVIAIVQ